LIESLHFHEAYSIRPDRMCKKKIKNASAPPLTHDFLSQEPFGANFAGTSPTPPILGIRGYRTSNQFRRGSV
jgi:hypothetical protein